MSGVTADGEQRRQQMLLAEERYKGHLHAGSISWSNFQLFIMRIPTRRVIDREESSVASL